MGTKLWAMGLMMLCTLLTSSAQILYKYGIPKLEFNILSIITNYFIISGLFFYVIGAGIMILALRGGELSTLYPIIATSYVWVALLSGILFGEDVHLLRWIGISFIIIGITFIGVGSNRRPKRSRRSRYREAAA